MKATTQIKKTKNKIKGIKHDVSWKSMSMTQVRKEIEVYPNDTLSIHSILFY